MELTPERQGIHAALAEQLADSPAIAAWHWSRAARPTEARAAHIRAPPRAARLDPAATVLLHYEEALELPTPGPSGPSVRAELLAGAATRRPRQARSGVRSRCCVAPSRPARSAVPRRMRAQRDTLEAPVARCDARGTGTDPVGRRRPAGALDSMERALGIMPRCAQSHPRLGAGTLAQHLMIVGRFEEVRSSPDRHAVTAVAAAKRGEDALAERGHAICTQGMDVAYLGDPSAGLALLEEAAVDRAKGRSARRPHARRRQSHHAAGP